MTALIGERIAAAARALVGAPFRLHGRQARTGLDCVGLVLGALRGAGIAVAEPSPYTLRGTRPASIVRLVERHDFVLSQGVETGQLLLAQTGPDQLHLMIQTERSLVHAHAGLGRVVEMVGLCPWPILGRWNPPQSVQAER